MFTSLPPWEAKRERRAASQAELQESGYDENVSDATIPRKLPPLSVGRVASVVFGVFFNFFNASTTSGHTR